MSEFLNPHISAHTQAFIRIAYSVLMLATLIATLPHARRFFVSDRWNGYAQAGPFTDLVQSPFAMPLVQLAWFGANVLLLVNYQTVLAALVNLLLCRYFFIGMRFRGILRGMGAPGFMSYWLAACVFFLEYARSMDPTQRLLPVALLAFKVDFAVIMLCAGQYKLFSGYARNNGLELGVVNPMWGRWWRFFSRVPPGSIVFRTLNHLAYLTEIGAAVLMLLPRTQAIGALLVAVSFVWIAANIRLAFLCEMVILCCFLYIAQGTFEDDLMARVVPNSAASPQLFAAAPAWLNDAIRYALVAYVVLLPIVKLMIYFNFYARRTFPKPVQRTLDAYAGFFDIKIWRVFTTDIINFSVNIYIQEAHGRRTLYSHHGRPFRYAHVGESICLASVFTTLKYYKSDRRLFEERLLRYARTVPCPPDCVLVFEYVSIGKRERDFAFTPVVEYVVDPRCGTVQDKVLDASFSVHAAAATSPIHEGVRPGSYAPAVQNGEKDN